VYPGRYVPDTICKLIREEKVTFSHCVPTILQMVLLRAGAGGGSVGVEDDHRWFGDDGQSGAHGAGSGD
jgi:acyl-CoA synthetase (AMP-forming)/AMP-acid ligase II